MTIVDENADERAVAAACRYCSNSSSWIGCLGKKCSHVFADEDDENSPGNAVWLILAESYWSTTEMEIDCLQGVLVLPEQKEAH